MNRARVLVVDDVRDMAETVARYLVAGGFREDLFFRLNGLRVRVPALRERPDDIAALIEHFLGKSRGRVPGTPVVGLSPEALRAFAAYAWPGNVRELENLVERLVVTGTGAQIDLAAVQEVLGPPRPVDRLEALLADPMTLVELEDRYMAGVLERAGGNKARAAEILGVDQSTIYRRVKPPKP